MRSTGDAPSARRVDAASGPRSADDASRLGRALSDVLGFVLIFGIVVSTVAVVYVGGFDALTEARDVQRFDNAERAFDVLDANVEDLALRGAPSRATEIRLADASIGFGPPVSFNVTTESGRWYQRSIRPIVYRTDDGSELVYANGALFRQYGDRAVMFDPPRIITGNRTLIPLVATDDASSGVSALDTRRLLVRTQVSGRNVARFENAKANLTITSPRASAWERYLEDDVGLTCTGPEDGVSGEVTCRLPPGDVYIQDVSVAVSFT
ncbi:DUF7289 family protein [Halobacterium zhouii]|uniref:DUF7289 family protein n=1 Tax=Halobacterium zhouii TaxID=2902624 RepID=UPI001E2C3905|nr:hypothetical protein [Halobacterium zhouii]